MAPETEPKEREKEGAKGKIESKVELEAKGLGKEHCGKLEEKPEAKPP